ncbi:MAG: NAD-dependent epimerase/dehydratase family protein [Saprospiraceae bacterium]|nr:NAD-dependent epimerase/dehydratase family protein [Saprospiraceae bacterium]
MSKTVILVTGSNGQIGTELVSALQKKHGQDSVIATDLKDNENSEGIFEFLDVMNFERVERVIKKYNVTQIYHLAALLSSSGEKNPALTWRINLDAYLNILQLAHKHKIEKIFFPSTIGVFGPTTPRINTPQNTSFVPGTVYGISKITGELWSQYYRNTYGLDIRGIRFPGVISYATIPKGGTTDFAVEIFFEAVKNKKYDCFLKADTRLPMVYMPDVLKATLDLMEAPKEDISISYAYNISGFSLTPAELNVAIKKYIPELQITYTPDKRQKIADSWSETIDDSLARKDWNWSPAYDMESMVKDMLDNIK